jgi:hypothetical protein
MVGKKAQTKWQHGVWAFLKKFPAELLGLAANNPNKPQKGAGDREKDPSRQALPKSTPANVPKFSIPNGFQYYE